ncbi:MAG: Ig-like domain-containing protein [Candidatus Poribacteria bacterium]|nr:Ig-like domain-containing protein [Candidatus Poribacteria bacterium]
MKNLMTRKVVLGVLMTLVLGFGGQGVVEALSDLSQDGLPDDLTNQNVELTLTTITAPLNQPTIRESVNVNVNGGGANFVVGDSTRTSYTWTEDDSDLSDGTDGSLTIPSLTISIRSPGEITVRISDTSSVSSADRQPEIVRTYYAVKNPLDVSLSDNIRFRGVTNGVGYPYDHRQDIQIYGGDSRHNLVTYTLDSSFNTGALYVKEGNNRARFGDDSLETSSAAQVWLSMGARTDLNTALTAGGTNLVTVRVEGNGNETTAVYIYGRPRLSVIVNESIDEDSPDQSGGVTVPSAFTATVRDESSDEGAAVPNVPVKFEVKDKTITGGRLFQTTGTTIVDSLNREISEPMQGVSTLYVRTARAASPSAIVDFQLGTAGRKQVVSVSAVGKSEDVPAYANINADRTLRLTGRQRRGTTNLYDLRIVVEDDGEPAPNVEVSFSVVKGSIPSQVAADRTGVVRVVYDSMGKSDPLTIVARAPKTGTDVDATDVEKVELTINVSGGSVTPRDNQNDNNQGTGRDALSFNLGTSITGNEGDQITLEARAIDRDGQRAPQVPVTFTISDSDVGTLSATSVNTNSNGVAGITLTLGEEDGSITASASGYDSATATITITPAPAGLQVASGDNQDGEPGSVLSSAFVVRFEDTEGNPISGAEVTFTVETGGGSLSSSTDTTDSDGEAETTLTLGTQGMRNTVRARVDSTAYPNVGSAVFTAEATRGPEAIVVVDGDDQIGQVGRLLDEDLSVQVVDSDDSGVSGVLVRFRVTEGRGRLSRNSDRTDPDGYAEVGFTPTADGEAVVEAYSTGLTSAFFTINTGEPPDAITIVSGNNQNGRPGARLANPLVVEVIDENDDPVSGVTVSFSVTAGGGSVSPAAATTNSSGRAQTRLTLGDDPGENTVRASVAGVSPVSFKATSGMQVHLNASQRPPMYWISKADGTLYRLVDDAIESLAPNVTGITNIAVDAANNVLYLSVQTGENRGEIRRANLNGGNVRTLKTLTAVPRGITVDSTGDTLYWANSRGRIQSMPTAGSTKLTNVLENLRNPTIVVSNGHLYWTESIGRIRRISLTDAQQTIQNIATGLGEPLGLSIAKGKVYWIERDADGSGSLNRSNLDGSNVQALKTFASGVPTSLAVDSGDNKIYWTKGAGKIQRSNLAGKFVRDVASGVMNPTGIALSVAATDGQMATTQPGTRNTEQANNAQSTYSRYDINRDGAVNNADTRAVAAAIGQSGADIANPRTDVDGNGMVDVTDLILVLGNLDDDVAAPTLAIDVKALDIDFDRVQEQVEVLLASGDASIAAQRALLYLQHLLASARPDETVLLANYPNPFNPETWIPYHLSESADVKINIYDAQGVLVRALTVGHQSAGYYTSRSRAAYWDGRNAFGERVASGIYFYQLQTDEMSPLRKMVILK